MSRDDATRRHFALCHSDLGVDHRVGGGVPGALIAQYFGKVEGKVV